MSRDYYDIHTYKPRKRRRRSRFNFKTVVILLIIFLVIALNIFARNSNYFMIKNIVVYGNENLTDKEIINASDIKNNKQLYYFKNSDVKEVIKKETGVKRVHILRVYPSTILIIIKERDPSFIISQKNIYYECDESGRILSASKSIDRYDVPLVTGVKIKNIHKNLKVYDDNKNVRIQTIQKVFEYFIDEKLYDKVSEVYVSDTGRYYVYLINGGVLKFANYSSFIAHKDFVNYFITKINKKQKVELIEGTNPIYSNVK